MKVGFVHLGRENLGVEYLSSVLKDAGHETALYYDPGLFGTNDNVFFSRRLERRFSRFDRIVRGIVRDKPDALAFSLYTNTFPWARAVLSAVRDAGWRGHALAGGIHATLVPEVVLAEMRPDAVIVGEAEAVIVPLLAALEGGGDLSVIGNLVYREGDTVRRTAMAPAIEDLDTVPLADKEMFAAEINYRDDYLVMTGRGCPLSCSFCCESSMNRLYDNRYYRRRSPAGVIEELKMARSRFGAREVMFNDAMFFVSPKWLKEFLPMYRREIGLPFRCFAYPKYMTRPIAEELKASGCYAVEFGLQTTNETIRREFLNRNETNERALESFHACDEVGLRYDVDHIFGLPGETHEDFVDAAKMYAGLKRLNRIKSHLLSHYPATPMVEREIAEGRISPEQAARIDRGEIGDFFHAPSVTGEATRAHVDNFLSLYAFLPVLPAFVTRRIVDAPAWRRLVGKLPVPIVVGLRVLAAIKGRDYRFWLYVKYYAHRIARHIGLSRSLRRKMAVPRASVQPAATTARN
ncbi:B12-binding domain-containing radical SAM protein [bacterium]|nr:B12-binding domain-containing radical SAM protein [bacterium]